MLFSIPPSNSFDSCFVCLHFLIGYFTRNTRKRNCISFQPQWNVMKAQFFLWRGKISFRVYENTLYDNFKILDRFAIKIKDNTNRLKNIIDELKLCLEAHQEINNNKTKSNNTRKMQAKNRKTWKYNNDANDKFRALEYRSRCSNLRFDGLIDSENET